VRAMIDPQVMIVAAALTCICAMLAMMLREAL
jgi:hypothetical protein